ncbi:MAG: hypothetical protein LBB77_02030 [Treponema sp.]|jgi:hypothetical protein|nr:hypothetical protein [Treponema sp.]
MNDLGNKTDEIAANKKYIYSNLGLYTIAALLIFFAAPVFIEGAAPIAIGFIFLAVGLFPLTKLNAKVELYEKGFTYGKKSYEWASIKSITWIKKTYRIFGAFPLPMFNYYKISSVPMELESTLLPELSGLYLSDLHYKLTTALEQAKNNGEQT